MPDAGESNAKYRNEKSRILENVVPTCVMAALFQVKDKNAPGLPLHARPISRRLLGPDVSVIFNELLSEAAAPLPPMAVLLAASATVCLPPLGAGLSAARLSNTPGGNPGSGEDCACNGEHAPKAIEARAITNVE